MAGAVYTGFDFCKKLCGGLNDSKWNASPSPISSLKNTSTSSAFTQTLSSPAVHNAFFLLSFSHFEVRNEKAGRYLRSMRLKKSIRFSHRFPHDDPLDLRILQKLLSFELNERPTVKELRKRLYLSSEREPSVQPVTKLEFEFERLKITKEAMPELIYSLLSTTQRF
ncbi:hypothetical protein Bca52824_056455 [Brassica carinata]|uniref:Uncharacterized protein n=1 Tax=Brassica carinata TaxID=52824 RepID=A0A8X7UBU6_BRACI|nr:hypothetical protein Bca52824_056455 [Brassica carinata]